ncbi:AAA family ATPase [Endozoicomonas sp. ONNA1]|uniref:AAA family ATPase n=1 Tax=Endozoicomonas sp. ONNA1 TaxID=2828740 RepID=UPI0021484972|nr:AAA family ATPase [Endozoicomonas sp. ONNA1]
MKEPILLLGPSGIGKTTVSKYAMKAVKNAHFIVLDNIVHKQARDSGLIDKKEDLNALIKFFENDRDRFVNYGLNVLEEHMKASDNQPIIVDVGTGFLDAKHSLEWVSSCKSLSIMATPAVAYDRFRKARKLDISFEQYMTTQFSPKRIALYNSADVVIKSDKLSQEALSRQFLFSALAMMPDSDQASVLKNYIARFE